MEKLVVGDVVVVPFPFTDSGRAKRRPALVLAVLGDGDYIFCQITSRAWPDSVSLCPTDFTEGSLPHDSYVRPEKLYTGNQTVVLSRADTRLMMFRRRFIVDYSRYFRHWTTCLTI